MEDEKRRKLEARLAVAQADDGDEIVPPTQPKRSSGIQPGETPEQARLRMYDMDGSGTLDELEKHIASYDTNLDGVFSVAEVKKIVEDLEKEEENVGRMQKIIFGVIFLSICGFATMFGVVLLANESSKDQAQDDNGALTVKGTDIVVQVASSDMVVTADGMLVPRDSASPGGERRMLAEGDSQPLRTADATIFHPLTSRVPDKYLLEVKSFEFTNPEDASVSSVTVHGFVRVPEYNAMCGSVVILQTNLGNFTLDDEQLYHAELDVYLTVTGEFSIDERRRLSSSDHGRRKLGMSGAVAAFAYLDEQAETFECVRSWMGDEHEVTPSSPQIPYSFVAEQIISCGEHNCFSSYGPNSGKPLAGVSGDGELMHSVVYGLVMENSTVQVTRHPLHPLQLLITLTDSTGLVEEGATTRVEWQMLSTEPGTRYHCRAGSSKPAPGVQNVTLENSQLSFMGYKNGLRHWVAVDSGTGKKAFDYFDEKDPGHTPHSFHLGYKTNKSSEMRFHEFDDSLSDDEVWQWLLEYMGGNHQFLDVRNQEYCTIETQKTFGVPSAMDPFVEDRDDVDWYTKQMMNVELDLIDPKFRGILKDTTLDEYWGAAMYLRRLLEEYHNTPMEKGTTSPKMRAMLLNRQDELTDLLFAVDSTDPLFWSELAAQIGLDPTSTKDDVNDFWTAVADIYMTTSIPLVQSLSDSSGLSILELRMPPQKPPYIVKADVESVLENTFEVASAPVTLAVPIDTANFIVFESSCPLVYRLASTASATTFDVYEVNDTPYDDTDDTEPDLGTTGTATRKAFFFSEYESAYEFCADTIQSTDSDQAQGSWTGELDWTGELVGTEECVCNNDPFATCSMRPDMCAALTADDVEMFGGIGVAGESGCAHFIAGCMTTAELESIEASQIANTTGRRRTQYCGMMCQNMGSGMGGGYGGIGKVRQDLYNSASPSPPMPSLGSQNSGWKSTGPAAPGSPWCPPPCTNSHGTCECCGGIMNAICTQQAKCAAPHDDKLCLAATVIKPCEGVETMNMNSMSGPRPQPGLLWHLCDELGIAFQGESGERTPTGDYSWADHNWEYGGPGFHMGTKNAANHHCKVMHESFVSMAISRNGVPKKLRQLGLDKYMSFEIAGKIEIGKGTCTEAVPGKWGAKDDYFFGELSGQATAQISICAGIQDVAVAEAGGSFTIGAYGKYIHHHHWNFGVGEVKLWGSIHLWVKGVLTGTCQIRGRDAMPGAVADGGTEVASLNFYGEAFAKFTDIRFGGSGVDMNWGIHLKGEIDIGPWTIPVFTAEITGSENNIFRPEDTAVGFLINRAAMK